MTKLVHIFVFVLAINAFGQKSSDFSISDQWTCVIIRDTITLELVDYYKANFYCGSFVYNSVAICKNKNGDTLRVIEFCPGPKDYKPGQLFTFTTYPYVTKDKKTFQKFLPANKSAKVKYKYNYIRPTSFGRLQVKK